MSLLVEEATEEMSSYTVHPQRQVLKCLINKWLEQERLSLRLTLIVNTDYAASHNITTVPLRSDRSLLTIGLSG